MSTAENSKVQTCYFVALPSFNIPFKKNDRNPQHVLFNFDIVHSCTRPIRFYDIHHIQHNMHVNFLFI